MAKSKTEPEIITPTVGTDEAEKYIKNAVAKFNITDHYLGEIKRKYGSLKITGPEDKANYELAVAGISELRTLRNRVEDKRKELKEFSLTYGRAVDAEAKRITESIVSAEENLRKERQRIDDEKEAIRLAEYQRKVKALTDAGFRFDGQLYIAGDVMLQAKRIDTLDEPTLQNFIESGQRELERIRQEEEARKRREQEQAERAAELERKERDLAEREARLSALEAEKDAVFPDTPVPTPEPEENGQQSQNQEPARQPIQQSAPMPSRLAQTFPARPIHAEFLAGANQMRNAIIRQFNTDEKHTKAEWIQIFKQLNPANL